MSDRLLHHVSHLPGTVPAAKIELKIGVYSHGCGKVGDQATEMFENWRHCEYHEPAITSPTSTFHQPY